MTDSAIADVIGVARRTIVRWRTDAGFLEWYAARMNRTSDVRWPAIVSRHELIALAGSVKSAEFVAKVRGVGAYATAQSPGAVAPLVDASTHYTVKILVQRPDDVASSTVLPLDDPRVLAASEGR